jgi:DNA-binding MarR family transcriptional regulator
MEPSRATRIADDYRYVHRALDRLALPTWLDLGLTMPQFKALVAVSGSEGVPVTKLGCELGIAQPSASLLVEALVQRGYAQRAEDPEDRRRALVTATAAGEELLAQLRLGRRQTFEDWLARLSEEDTAALERGLGALAAVACKTATEEKQAKGGCSE